MPHQDAITFGLAGLGYLLLAKDTALRLAGRRWPILGWLTAGVVLVHVLLIWALRFEWSINTAWTKSPPAFVIFHFALLLILAAPWLKGVSRDRVTFAAFGIVSIGALPAPFRYPETAVLAIPLIAAASGVVTVFAMSRIQKR